MLSYRNRPQLLTLYRPLLDLQLVASVVSARQSQRFFLKISFPLMFSRI